MSIQRAGRTRIVGLLIALALSLTGGAPRAQQDCTPTWQPIFVAPQDLDSTVHALVVFDDGNGPALYAGGEFTHAGGVSANRIAKWDGAAWSPLGNGVSGASFPHDPEVRALAVFDGGGGLELYAGGEFAFAGGVSANRIAKWDGAAWSPLGNGVSGPNFPDAPEVRALAVYDAGLGGGPELFVGGGFTNFVSFPTATVVNGIVRWDGEAWHDVGAGADGTIPVRALATFDDGRGGGPALYAGGTFHTMDGVPADGVARWDGTSWTSAANGPQTITINCFAVFDDGLGGGPALYAGGSFGAIDGVPAASIARWNGVAWSPLAGGGATGKIINALAVFDDGSGPALYAAGDFLSIGGVTAGHIAKWNGTAWSRLEEGLGSQFGAGFALASFDAGSGPALIAGGMFLQAGGDASPYIAEWKGCPPSPWTDLGNALPGVNGPPLLVGTGDLVAGQPAALDLTNAKASSPSVLFVSLSSVPVPFKGGLLLPVPAAVMLAFSTDATGTIALPFAWPAGLPAGFDLYYQYAIQDAAAVHGVSLSNALKSTTP